MLELREITAAYEVWQAAGLKPNWGSEDAKKLSKGKPWSVINTQTLRCGAILLIISLIIINIGQHGQILIILYQSYDK